MSSARRVPAAVLSERLSEAIRGRPVRAAVFTTFTFDPGFFEQNVMPLLFDQPFSQVDKVRTIQLEEAMRGLRVAVYYDRGGLSPDAEPARLDYRRIDVRRRTGVFHPKLVLLLVDELPEESEEDEESSPPPALPQSLIVAVLSANLTRAGWWENVECAHIEEIPSARLDDRRCSFRRDLLGLLQQIRKSAGPGEDHAALDEVHDFLRHDTPRKDYSRHRSDGRFFTRLFYGQGRASLIDWLAELRLRDFEWNLEVISPYFDPRHSGPLADLVASMEPRETRIFLPREPDGTAAVTHETYAAIEGLPRCHWARAPDELLQRGRSRPDDKLAPRRVHAKVYRFWSKEVGDVLLVGSINLTESGHSHSGAGNLEAAFLVDVSDEGLPRRWWLDPLDAEPERFIEAAPSEEDGLLGAPLDLSVRYDWSRERASYRLAEEGTDWVELAELSGRPIARIECPGTGSWNDLDEETSAHLATLLRSTSFLTARAPGREWRLLVREEGMEQRPSLLLELSPEEILEYWALLTPAQRAAYLDEHAALGENLEGLTIERRNPLRSRDTLFDRFAGLYHAFGCLRSQVEEAIRDDRPMEAELRLLGEKYDSLPNLLRKVRDRETGQSSGDPVLAYVTFLAAQQLFEALKEKEPAFFAERVTQTRKLEQLLAALPELRGRMGLEDPDADEFLAWYEQAFLMELETTASPR